MGVIRNFIDIRRIVGRGWNGTTIDDILKSRPMPQVTLQPTDTSGASVKFTINQYGMSYRLQKMEADEWVDVGSVQGSSINNPTVSLSSIATTSVCRVKINPTGSNDTIYTNEFTVTR